MAIYVTRSPKWKTVEGARTVRKTCPRCNNAGDFRLVYDTETFTWIPINWIYVLHCPICIYYEEVSKSLRRSLMEPT